MTPQKTIYKDHIQEIDLVQEYTDTQTNTNCID